MDFNQTERNFENSLDTEFNTQYIEHESKQEELAAMDCKVEQEILDGNEDTCIHYLQNFSEGAHAVEIAQFIRSHFLAHPHHTMSTHSENSLLEIAESRVEVSL